MADPTPVPDIEQDSVLLMPPATYPRQYSRFNQFAVQKHRTDAEWMELHESLKRNGEVFVQFVDPGSKRYGTIAKAKQYYSKYDRARSVDPSRGYRNLELNWDGRRNTATINTLYEAVTWLPNYTGPTVWAYDRTRKPIELKPTLDRLGREIVAGSFCAYILYHFDSEGAAGIYFGKVSKIDRDGTIWFKNIKLGENDRVAEKRVKDNSNIIMLTKDLLEQLMLARLSVL